MDDAPANALLNLKCFHPEPGRMFVSKLIEHSTALSRLTKCLLIGETRFAILPSLSTRELRGRPKSVCWISVRNGKVYRRFISLLTRAQDSLLPRSCPSGIEHRDRDSGGLRSREPIMVGRPLSTRSSGSAESKHRQYIASIESIGSIESIKVSSILG